MTDLIPNVKGPKLLPFPHDIQDIEFAQLLSSAEDSSPSDVPHSKVFKVRLGGKDYALKVVSRFS